jgi:hypothetical protein
VKLQINSATSALRKAIKQLKEQGFRIVSDWHENLKTGKRFKYWGIHGKRFWVL